MFYDTHSHSQFSFDGKRTSVEKSAKSALLNGLGGICFTDHYDAYVPKMIEKGDPQVSEMFDIPAQQAEIDRLNSILRAGKIEKDGFLDGIPRSEWSKVKKFKIFKGIELGLYDKAHDAIHKVLQDNEFDEVIASLHYIDETDPYYGHYYNGKNWKEAFGHYLEMLYKEIKWLGKDFDIMGHFDYIVRYAPYPKSSIFYNDFSAEIDEILKFLIQEGKCLEINTKTYQKYGIRTPELDSDILLRYRELGGELISLGSDSHTAESVGNKFMYYAQFVKMYGFRWLAHYEGRRLKQVTI